MPKRRAPLPLFDPVPTDEAGRVSAEESILIRIMPEMGASLGKKPLQCVTYKQVIPEFHRMRNIAQHWELSYSDLLRIAVFRFVQVLENPGEDLKQLLVAHRANEQEKKRLRELKRRPRMYMAKAG